MGWEWFNWLTYGFKFPETTQIELENEWWESKNKCSALAWLSGGNIQWDGRWRASQLFHSASTTLFLSFFHLLYVNLPVQA